ncbi:MAG: hypothetical protein CL912_15025 [Deltaproteobacteria bacterium]|nr:hypothetical protein [Deltaproteobacteria bacterium]
MAWNRTDYNKIGRNCTFQRCLFQCLSIGRMQLLQDNHVLTLLVFARNASFVCILLRAADGKAKDPNHKIATQWTISPIHKVEQAP